MQKQNIEGSHLYPISISLGNIQDEINLLSKQAFDNRFNVYDYLSIAEKIIEEIEPISLTDGDDNYLKTTDQGKSNSNTFHKNEEQPKENEVVSPSKRKNKSKDIIYLKVTLCSILVKKAREIGHPICYLNGYFYIYNSIFYVRLVERPYIKHIIKCAGLKAGVNPKICSDITFLDNCYKQLEQEAFVIKNTKSTNMLMVNLQNGTLKFKNGCYEFNQHLPDDLLTYVLPLHYNPDAEAAIWLQHLAKVLPIDEAQKLLAEHIAYSFIPTSELKLEKVAVLLGDGANGKSVIFDVVTATLGSENVVSYPIEQLTDNKGYHRAELNGKLLNYCSEISVKSNPEVFKKLASGEPIDARSPYKEPEIISNYAKIMFNANELPRVVEHNNAYFRRLHIIPFEVTIPEPEQDKDLAKKIIQTELPGVLNWILEGLKRLVANRAFTNCEKVNKERLKYESETDSVTQFVQDIGLTPNPNNKITAEEVFRAYVNYCQENLFKPCAKTTFVKRLKRLGFDNKRSSQCSFILAEYASRAMNPEDL